MAMAAASVPMPVLCSTGASSRNMKKNATNAHQGKDRAVGGLGQFSQVVRNDVQFLKARISKGVGWAYEALRIPQLFKTLDEVLGRGIGRRDGVGSSKPKPLILENLGWGGAEAQS
ncbi:hypothetical protein RJ640_006266 [Escallonia rubra]|uniref:Uncharacterized protein n=1 Tax=Escallonia rubra TaxID=112253 RepID=A0AA88RIR0_9ASTE|nr:hypothetical protein RJ640_006266 [Escallonia rubra]